jgi:hypothetical protein
VPKLVSLSPTLAEALAEMEGTIQQIHQIDEAPKKRINFREDMYG